MGENLYEVETTMETLHIIAESENEARQKGNEFLRENYASGRENVLDVTLLSETRKFKTDKQLIT